jgi:NAD(P)-dependent dehydrogenase (short-subunit alcohol dehydrogenase family)
VSVLRPGLLDGVGVALAGADPADPADPADAADAAPGPAISRDTLAVELGRLGARVVAMAPPGREREDEEPGDWAAQHGPLRALVFDAASAFGDGGAERLMGTLDAAWAAVLELATYLIAEQRPGKLLLVAPAPQAGAHAVPAGDALENLARTLSVEWARHAITTCAIVPGPAMSPAQLSELVAYLISPAGDYFTGCRIELGAVAVAQTPRPGSSAQGTITASS